jgi:hypothetical protein
MPSGYCYVEGDALGSFILQVRKEFVDCRLYLDHDTGQPGSIRLVAIDAFERKTIDERLLILHDLLAANRGLIVNREEYRDIFEHSDTPIAYLTDLVCEVAHQVLVRDPNIRSEDEERMALAARPRVTQRASTKGRLRGR